MGKIQPQGLTLAIENCGELSSKNMTLMNQLPTQQISQDNNHWWIKLCRIGCELLTKLCKVTSWHCYVPNYSYIAR